MGLCAFLVSARPGAAAESNSFLFYHFRPPVIYDSESSLTTLEVATSGQDIDEVVITSPSLGPMVDDGTHGDRFSGDGIYTLDGIPGALFSPPSRRRGTHGTRGLEVTIFKRDGTREVRWEPRIGLVREGQRFPALKLDENLFATRSAFFIVDRGGEVFDGEPPLAKVDVGITSFTAFFELYSVLPDEFDFVVVMPSSAIFDPSRGYRERVPYTVRVKNEVRNVGIPMFDRTWEFGSDGRLLAMIYHSWGTGQVLDHELGHAWSANYGQAFDLSYCRDCYGAHWNPNVDIGGQMAAFLFHPKVRTGAGHLMNNPDGTWRIERELGTETPYSKLDLYLMGLIPSREVPPVNRLINADFSNPRRVTAEGVVTYDIEQLMQAEGGERIPSWEESPREFKVAFVIVGNEEFTPAELDFYSLVAEYFTSTEPGEGFLTPFYAATGGRATLDARLPLPPILHIEVNQPAFSPGETLDVSLMVDNSGMVLPYLVDFYLGALLPDGDSLVFFDPDFNTALGSLSDLSTLSPIASEVNLFEKFVVNEPSFFRYAWSGEEPAGLYRMFLMAVIPNGFADGSIDDGDILAVSGAELVFTR